MSHIDPEAVDDHERVADLIGELALHYTDTANAADLAGTTRPVTLLVPESRVVSATFVSVGLVSTFDDLWLDGSASVQTLGDYYRVIAQKYSRLAPYYRGRAGDLRIEAAAEAKPANNGPPLTSLAAWYRADSTTRNASARIGAVTDRTGAGRNATQATDAQKALWVANVIDTAPAEYFTYRVRGKQVMRCDGARRFAQLSSISLTGNTLVSFLVFKGTSAGVVHYLYDNAGVAPYLRVNADGKLEADGVVTSGAHAGSWVSVVVVHGSASTAVRVNGSQVASGAATAPASVTIDLLNRAAASGFQGDVADIGFYSASVADLAALETYLRNRYGTW